jgi:hypothetical protein
MKFHPLANLFPLIEGKPFDDLVASIRENGQREPIIVLDDQILDGRNRYRACLAAEVEPVFAAFAGSDPVRFVVDVNVHRRHLNESQRALIAASIAKLNHGENQHTNMEAQIRASTQREVAELLNVGHTSVQAARRVLNEAEEKDIADIREGKATVSGVAKRLHHKSRRRNRPARLSIVPTETQHDRDLSFLQSAWDSACESAREAFLAKLGFARGS